MHKARLHMLVVRFKDVFATATSPRCAHGSCCRCKVKVTKW